MPVSTCPPWMRSGGTPPSSVSMRAPILASGTVTRRIGRLLSEASPINTLSKRCAASKPASKRIPVPALPQSSGAALGCKPSMPTPCTTRRDGDGISMRTPKRSKMAAVARVSSPSKNPSMVDVPSANAASITERCDTDLSPGMVNTPCNGAPACAVQFKPLTPSPHPAPPTDVHCLAPCPP